MENATVSTEYQRKPQKVVALQFTGGQESADAINEFVSKLGDLKAVLGPAQTAKNTEHGKIIHNGWPEHLLIYVGDSHSVGMDLNDYIVFDDLDAFFIGDSFTIEMAESFRNKYEPLK
jgi:hypothetical protein